MAIAIHLCVTCKHRNAEIEMCRAGHGGILFATVSVCYNYEYKEVNNETDS